MIKWYDDEISRQNNVIRTLIDMLKAAGVHPAIIDKAVENAYHNAEIIQGD